MLQNCKFTLLFKHNSFSIRRISTTYKKTPRKGHDVNWAVLKRKKWGSDYCLENFDEYYKPLYGRFWSSIRLALLSQQKYCAFVNNFGDVEHSTSLMKKLGAKDIRRQYNSRLWELLRVMREGAPEGSSEGLLKIGVQDSADYEEEEEEETNEKWISEELDAAGRFASLATHQSGNFDEFVPATKLKGLADYVDEADYLYQKNTGGSFNFLTVREKPSLLPMNWKICAFKRGNISTFPQPRKDNEDLLGFYLMDLASLLPVLALNPKAGDVILDMCAAPGGKSLAILQTLNDVNLTCNDTDLSRLKHLQHVLQTFVPQFKNVDRRPKLVLSNGIKIAAEKSGIYNKILVDAPCTNDRHSANKDENNMFKPTRIAERTRLPQLQADLLSAALQSVKHGGTVVYSTCSLSPIQNDGVVHMALQKVWQDSSSNFVIHDLSDLFYPLGSMFYFHSGLKYGQLVIPNVLNNFGPMYVCKISKLKS